MSPTQATALYRQYKELQAQFHKLDERLRHQEGRTIELLDRALEIIESAYRTREWLLYSRTERTDETLKLITEAIGPKEDDATFHR